MKRNHQLITLWVALLALASCSTGKEYYLFSTFREPADKGLFLAYSDDGYHWSDLGGPWLKPEIGQQKVMRDPSVVQGPDGTFHLVWTSSWRGDLGFGYASSKDLINWSPEQFIPVTTDTATVNVWAPELFYDDEQQQFVIIWASTVPFKFEKGEEEERNNHRMYGTTTKDFKTFSETRLFLDPGFSVIDCVIVKRAPGDYVLILKDNTRPMRNIKVAFGESPLGPWREVSAPFTPFKSEGPAVAKVHGDYLIYYDHYGEMNFGCVRTRDFKSFEDISALVSLPEGHKHGTIFKVKKSVVEALKAAHPLNN